MDHADVGYLESKRTVDDRARSVRVRDRLLEALPDRPNVVDAGAGTGVMLHHLLDWGVRPRTYRGVDQAAPLVEHARRTLPGRLAEAYSVETGREGFSVEGTDVRFDTGDVLDMADESADLVVAQALLDLLPIEDAMDAIARALRPGGLAYLPITFDGLSLFLPAHPDDRAVVDAYHAAIDEVPGRDSHAGRMLLDHLRKQHGTLLAVDASDWIVHPCGGDYPADESAFLESILEFVADATNGRTVDAGDWLAVRHEQLEAAQLTYVAHGYDFLYRTAGSE